MSENLSLTQEFITTPIQEINLWLYKIIVRTTSIALTNETNITCVDDIDALISSYQEQIAKTEERIKEVLDLKIDKEKALKIAEEDKETALKNLNAYLESKKEMLEDFNAKTAHINL